MHEHKTLVVDVPLTASVVAGQAIRCTLKQPIVLGGPNRESHDERQARLSAAFDLVRPAEHWKYPIDAVIPADQRASVEEAVAYFTGSTCTFRILPDKRLRVLAEGYYLTIGA